MENNNVKIMALYLPAYHRIKENDEWWGKGFTEWDNVKRGKPLYKGHLQPQIPLGDNYYDLSKKEDIKKQWELAKKYGLDGFVCYHYWFNGKKLLEKPCEIVLDNKDIDFPFCFCWANEPWARTWDGKNTDILMPQEYGNKNDWIEHIKYLIQFFKDDRYIKIDNKPVFYIYSPSQIPNFDEMIECWNNYLIKEGLETIYLVEYICTKNPYPISNNSQAVMEFQPMCVNRFNISNFLKLKRVICKKLKIIDFGNYDYLWEKILRNKKTYDNREIFKGCFVGWDNSPRKGKNSMIVRGATPEKFKRYLFELSKKYRKNSNKNIIVINAWNEWGEGAMLEPTEKDKYKYLQIIKEVKDYYEE